MSEYSELLKHPKWQKKRLLIFKKDDYQCQCCFDKENTLVVHHKYYERNKKPWEYKDCDLITLCEKCHNLLHKHYDMKYAGELYKMAKSSGVNFTDYFIIEMRILQINKQQGNIRGAIQLLTANMITEYQI